MADHRLLTVPQKAGHTSLLTQLVDGNVVILQSRASGKTLRSFHGTAQGIGGFGAHAQWRVHVRRTGVIALQNVHTSEHWLAIHNGKTIGNGQGGPYCDLIALEVEGHLVLESVQYCGQHVGVLPDGVVKEPGKTGTGKHAQFVLHTHKSVKFVFVDGSVVVLQSCASGKSLRSYHGTLQGIGGRGLHAQWKIHVRRPGVIALQNMHTSQHWLAIHDGKTIGNGRGGPYCEFIVKESNDHVVLESVQYRGQHVGVLPDGTVKEPGRTGTGKPAQFIPSTISTANTDVLGVATQMAGVHLNSPLLNMFVHGCVMILVSKASAKTLRSFHGTAQGIGGHGVHAQWKVHVRRPGVIALQNMHTSQHWLAIHNGKTIGNGGGGPFCEFKLQAVNDHVVLESTQYPGQHVGVRPDGSVKAPTETGTGAHAQFRPIVHMQAAGSQSSVSVANVPSAPPPGLPQPFPPSHVHPVAGYPPPQNPAYPLGYQPPPPPYGYPGYQPAPAPPVGYQPTQAPPPTGYPGYQPAGYPGYQAAPPTGGYAGQPAPSTSGYYGNQPPPPI